MRLGSGRLGSRSSRLGGGAGPATSPETSGGIWIDYKWRAFERLLAAWVDRLQGFGVERAAIAHAGADPPAAVSPAVVATIDDDDAARRTNSPPAYIER